MVRPLLAVVRLVVFPTFHRRVVAWLPQLRAECTEKEPEKTPTLDFNASYPAVVKRLGKWSQVPSTLQDSS